MQPGEALAAARRALEVAEGLFGPDHVEVGEVLADLARLHVFKDRFADAEPLDQRAIAIMEKALGADHPAFADFLVRIAAPYRRKRFARVRPLYKRALDIYERAWPDDPKLPIKFFDLGNDLDSLGHRVDAIPLYERARALADKILADNPWSIIVLGRLPYAYLVRGRYADAERAVRWDMAVIARRFGSELQEAVRSGDLHFLARVYFEQGYYDDAEWLCKRALRLDQKPGETPSPAAVARHVTHELGPIYFAQARYAEAEEIYARELERLEEAFASEAATKAERAAIRDRLRAIPLSDLKARQPLMQELARLYARLPRRSEIADTLAKLGAINRKQGRRAEAQALFERALAMLGDMREQSAVTITLGMAHLHFDADRHADAEQLYSRALQLAEDGREPQDPPSATAADILNDLGRLARKQNQLEHAEQLHKRALAIVEELGPDRIDVGITLIDLAEVYRAQSRFAEAEPLYQRALAICEKGDFSPNHDLVRTTLAGLAALYADQGRTADADRLKRGGPHPELWVR